MSVLVLALLASGPAGAVQFEPSATARLHSLSSGQPGLEYATATSQTAVYSRDERRLEIQAQVGTLNYFDEASSACPSDRGSNCQRELVTALDFDLRAVLRSTAVRPLGGSLYDVAIQFESTGGDDLVWRDPSDAERVLLVARWVRGILQGGHHEGLSLQGIFDTEEGALVDGLSAVGLARITGGPYATLFERQLATAVGFNIASFEVSTSLNAAIAALISSGLLEDFATEVSGQVFGPAPLAVAQVPEPTPGLLLLLGLTGLGLRRRARVG